MINLLADTKKQEIRAGRTNVILVRYLIWVAVTGAVLAGIATMALIELNSSRKNAQAQVAESNIQAVKFKPTETKATAFRQDLATAKQILDKEVAYSRAILTIANSLPKGVYIDTLSLDATKLDTPTDMTFHAQSEAGALALKTALENNQTMYGDVHFKSVTLSDKGEDDYPVEVIVSLIIKKAVLQ